MKHARFIIAQRANIIAFFAIIVIAGFSTMAYGQTDTTRPPDEAQSYEPLKIEAAKIETLELLHEDSARSREIPLLIYLPESNQPTPVIIHSHGLGGTNKTSAFLGKHWAARGFLAVFVQHPGSDDSVWKDVPRLQRMRAMRKAASGENLKLRVGDVDAVIDQLHHWNSETAHPLAQRMDLNHIGMSGHSFGAVTTQHVSGMAGLGNTNKKIRAAIPMSPSAPRFASAEKAFGNVKIPWLCMTGTHDVSAIGGADVKSRRSVYKALPAGDKYELVLFEAEHSVFTQSALPGERKKRNPNHHVAIKGISTAFWDAYLRKDQVAKQWLKDDDAVRSLLQSQDRWQTK